MEAKKIMQVSEHIWIVPPQWKYVEPTIGFIISNEGVVVIDTGNSPEHGRRALAALRTVTDQPIKYVINTHRHWDHTFGNQIFAAPIIAHTYCKDKMISNMKDDWADDQVYTWVTGFVLQHVKTLGVERFEGVRVVLPQISFSGTMRLDIGKIPLDLYYAGSGHTRDSIVVHLPSESALFLSDCVYPNPEGKIHKLAMLFPKLSQLSADTYIPGHELPYGKEKWALRADYYRELIESVKRLRRQHAAREKILEYPLDRRFKSVSGLNEKSHREMISRVLGEIRKK
ncbi:MBL fold metallo-hydrolase [Candidatus Acetothermia bacterium]|nr:MBL fold metallo-hydrolase [Candidatus Acetothermia bacterium]